MTIELEQVTKRFGGREILKDLTLDISTDTSYLITGESGSGKTTLLRILAGLEKPDEGRIRLLGDYKYTWLSCGVVFQNDRLIEYLSAVKNVSVIRKLTSDKAAREELEKLLAGYSGTLLFVSHDEEFIRKTATRILRFENGKLAAYEGGWTEMRKPKKKDQAEEERKLSISRMEMEMSVLSARMSAPKKGDRPDELQAEFLRLAEKIRALRSTR